MPVDTAPLVALLRAKAYERREEPFTLSSGAESHDYVDCRRGLAAGPDLALAARVTADHIAAVGVEFDVVGGLTMGADPLAHGLAIATRAAWFSVRKEGKAHGAGRRIEGAAVEPGVRALVLDDVASSGGSVLDALDAVQAAGAEVVLALVLLDRGERATAAFAERGVPYAPVLTYADLGIEPI